jgi:hypothetical protein
MVDKICFEKSKVYVENNILDLEKLVSEVRQNKWLKEMLLTKK